MIITSFSCKNARPSSLRCRWQCRLTDDNPQRRGYNVELPSNVAATERERFQWWNRFDVICCFSGRSLKVQRLNDFVGLLNARGRFDYRTGERRDWKCRINVRVIRHSERFCDIPGAFALDQLDNERNDPHLWLFLAKKFIENDELEFWCTVAADNIYTHLYSH